MFTKVFISLTVLCVISVGTLSGQPVLLDEADCPQICPDNLDPVCGSDGTTYQEFANPCEFKFNNCHKQQTSVKSFVATDLDWCRTQQLDDLDSLLVKMGNVDLNKPECLRACNKIYNPVCISNGNYRTVINNECFMDTINCAVGKQDTPAFKILQYGAC